MARLVCCDWGEVKSLFTRDAELRRDVSAAGVFPIYVVLYTLLQPLAHNEGGGGGDQVEHLHRKIKRSC